MNSMWCTASSPFEITSFLLVFFFAIAPLLCGCKPQQGKKNSKFKANFYGMLAQFTRMWLIRCDWFPSSFFFVGPPKMWFFCLILGFEFPRKEQINYGRPPSLGRPHATEWMPKGVIYSHKKNTNKRCQWMELNCWQHSRRRSRRVFSRALFSIHWTTGEFGLFYTCIRYSACEHSKHRHFARRYFANILCGFVGSWPTFRSRARLRVLCRHHVQGDGASLPFWLFNWQPHSKW